MPGEVVEFEALVNVVPNAAGIEAFVDSLAAKLQALRDLAAIPAGAAGGAAITAGEGSLAAQVGVYEQAAKQIEAISRSVAGIDSEKLALLQGFAGGGLRTGVTEVLAERGSSVTPQRFEKAVESFQSVAPTFGFLSPKVLGGTGFEAPVAAADTAAIADRVAQNKAALDAILFPPQRAIPQYPTSIVGLSNDAPEGSISDRKLAQDQYDRLAQQVRVTSALGDEGSDYAQLTAKLRINLQKASAAIENELLAIENETTGRNEYATALADTRIAQAQTNASVNEQLAASSTYTTALAENTAAQRAAKARVEETLATETNYAQSTAELAAARRLVAVQEKELEQAGRGLGRIVSNAPNSQGLIVPGENLTDAEGLAALQLREASVAKGAAVEKARLQIAQASLGFSEAEATALVEGAAAQKAYSAAVRQGVAQIERNNYEQGVANGSREAGTFFQRLQASTASRGDSGNFKDPTQYSELGQFLSGKFLTTAGFAVSGLATFAIFGQIQKMITDSKALEIELSQVKAQFDSLGQSEGFATFRDGIRQIAADTGTSGAQIAQLAATFKGALGAGAGGTLSDTAILEQVKSAAEFAKLEGVTLQDVGQNMLAIAKTYGISVTEIGDKTIALFQRTGVGAKEIVDALGSIVPIADQVGLSVDKTAAIIATAAEFTGRSATVVGQSFARVLTEIDANASKIDTFFQQAAPTAEPGILTALSSGQSGKVLEEVSKIYSKLSSGQQTEIRNLLGRPRDIQDIIPLLEHYNTLVNNTAASQNSAGTQTKAYANLQDTLGQQLSRITASFGQFGEAILKLGLSTALQEVVKALGSIIATAGTVLTFFSGINDFFGGAPGKILGTLAPLLLLLKALTALKEATIGEFILGTVSRAPGSAALLNLTRTAASTQEASKVAETAATGGGSTLPSGLIIPGGFAAGSKALEEEVSTSEKTIPPFFIRWKDSIRDTSKSLASGVETAAGDMKGTFLKASIAIESGMNRAAQGILTAAETLGPLIAITIGIVLLQYAQQKVAQVRALEAKASETEADVLSKLPYSELTSRQTAANFAPTERGTEGLKTEIGKRVSQAQVAALETLKPEDLKALTDQYYNKDTNNPITPDQLKSYSGTGNKDQAALVQSIFNDAKKKHENLIKFVNDFLNAQDIAQKQVLADAQNINDVKLAEAKFNVGEITPAQYASAIDKAITSDRRLLDSFIKSGDQTGVDQQSQLLNQHYAARSALQKKQYDSLVAQARITSQVTGATPVEQDQAGAAAGIKALSTQEIIPGDQNQLAAAQDYIAKRQQYATELAKGADSLGQAVKILNSGAGTVPAVVLQILNEAALQNSPEIIGTNLAILSQKMGSQFNKFEAELASAMSKGVAAVRQFLITQIADLEYLAANAAPGTDISGLIAQGTALQNLLANSSSIPKGFDAKIKTPFTSGALASAQQALDVAKAFGDPLAAANAQVADANATLNDIIANDHGVDRHANIKNARAALLQAQLQQTDAQSSIVQAQAGVTVALADNDPVKAAVAQLAVANAQAASAHGTAAKLQALAAQITAEHAIRDAIFAIADAQSSLLIAIDTAAGNTVKAAQDALNQARAVQSRDLAKGVDPKSAQGLGDQQKVVEQQANLRNTVLQRAEDQINFLLATNKIFDGQAIARLRVLDANQNLTTAQHHQIEEQIYSLKHKLESDLQFNLPTDIKLPTLYEARRFDQSGGAAGYQDNRKIDIRISTNQHVDTNKVISTVVDAINAPSRSGVQRKSY